MIKRKRPGRTENPNSDVNVTKRRLEAEYGEYWADGKPWTNEGYNEFLEYYLVKELCCVARKGRPSFHTCMGRSYKSVNTLISKLSIRYRQEDGEHHHNPCDYVPENRTDRTGTPFTPRDLSIIAKATDERGIELGANDPAWIGKVLARSVPDIKTWMKKRAYGGSGFGTTQTFPLQKGETEDQRITRLVQDSLKGIFESVMQSLGGR